MKFLALILGLIFTAPEEHDFKLAHYQLSRSENEIKLFVRVDRFDFLNAVSSCTESSELSTCMSNYLKKHFSLSLNGEKRKYKYLNHKLKAEFIELDFTLGDFSQEIKEIKVYNDVLLELYEAQENIIVSLLHGRKRSFRLNKGRFETTIKY